jgi:hypothetical protein
MGSSGPSLAPLTQTIDLLHPLDLAGVIWHTSITGVGLMLV